MADEKLEQQLTLLADACGRAARWRVVACQAAGNVAAAIVLYAGGTFALWLLEQSPAVKVAGFIFGLAAIGAAGLILAVAAVAVNRRIISPNGDPWDLRHDLVFLRNNSLGLVQSYAPFFAVFSLVLCVLLIPIAAARMGTIGQLLYAPLLIPMVAAAAAALLALLVGIVLVPAELSSGEKDWMGTFRAVLAYLLKRPGGCAWELAGAFAVAAVVALPPAGLTVAACWLLNELSGPVGGVELGLVAGLLHDASWAIMVGIIAALPMACFNASVGFAYRRNAERVQESHRPAREPAEESPE